MVLFYSFLFSLGRIIPGMELLKKNCLNFSRDLSGELTLLGLAIERVLENSYSINKQVRTVVLE